jgi:glycosyltransferase involved in cell wall biosynthesis
VRILHVTDTFLPRLGGIELHVADLAARQVAAGHEVLVLTGEQQTPVADDAPAERAGVEVARMRSSITGTGIAVSLGPVIAGFAPDVIHAHLSVGSPFTWAVLRNTAGTPVLASLHSLLPRLPRLIRAGLAATGIPTSRTTFTAVSDVAAERLRPALPAGEPVHVLHNGIDPGRWVVAHEPSDAFEILSVGRLAARKRPLVLVEALAELTAAVPDLAWRATLVGDGAQRAKVAAAVHAHGLADRVRLPGARDRSGIRRLLARADVFVAPATLESFGIAALEARCAGVPVLGMAASGVTEFVTDGTEGLLARDDADLARCLARLATDRGLLESIRRHNATTSVPMGWSSVLDDHDRLYATAVRRSAPGVLHLAAPVDPAARRDPIAQPARFVS